MHIVPGPSMNPTAWQALVFAMALVLSVREVAPAIYERTTATFPKTKQKRLYLENLRNIYVFNHMRKLAKRPTV